LQAVEQLHGQVEFPIKYQSTRETGTVVSSLKSNRLNEGQKATFPASDHQHHRALQSSAMRGIEKRRAI
jgi:hypothetical protein